MKIDELLKRLKNVEIDKDEINERREIAEYLAQILSAKESPYANYIMMTDKTMYDLNLYKDLLRYGKISSNDAYVYVVDHYLGRYDSSSYLYPFLDCGFCFINVYLSKLGFSSSSLGFSSSSYGTVPAPGLKYFAIVNYFIDAKRTVVEVANIDNVVTNTNLPPLKHDVLSTKHIYYDEAEEAVSRIISQKPLAGHDFIEARDVINRYYAFQEISLAKEVEDIRDAYNHIFKPFRIIYDLKTKQFQVSGNNEDR